MKAFVDEQVERKGYGSSSEYIRELLRKAQDRERLRGLLLEGLSGPVIGVADDAYFDGLHQRIRTGTTARDAKSAGGSRSPAKGGPRSARKRP